MVYEEKAAQNGFGSPRGKRSTEQSPSRLPLSATSGSATELAAHKSVEFSASVSCTQGSMSTPTHNTSDLPTMSKLQASPSGKGSSPPAPRAAPTGRTVSGGTTAARPPADLQWSAAMERLIMNSTKHVDSIEQVGYQGVTVVLHAMPALQKMARGATKQRDRLGNSARLSMRRAATADLLAATNTLLSDLAHLYDLLGGSHGRTRTRRIETLLKDLDGGQKAFDEVNKEMKLAGRFMLMREPSALNEDVEHRIADQGQRDTRQLDNVLRAVQGAQNTLGSIWSTLTTLRDSGVTPEDPAWPLLQGLDISTASDVLATLQLNVKPGANGTSAAVQAAEPANEANPLPQASPGLGRAWWRTGSMGRSPSKKSPTKSPSGKSLKNSRSVGSGLASMACFDAALEDPYASPWEAEGALDNVIGGDTPTVQIRQLRSGEVYRGGILKGVKSGFGQFEYSSGDKYEGQFEADTMHGFGVYAFATGGLYQGQWQNGLYDGLGVETFPTGGTYHGEFVAGARSGWGACSFANGDYYEGQWAGGTRHARGMQQCPDHSSYVGDYENGKRHGQGCYNFVNGDRYLGDYADDVPGGFGVYLFSSGQTYEGEWKDGSKHGWCVYSLTTGEKWAGRWEHGRPKWMQKLPPSNKEASSNQEEVGLALDAAAAARAAGNIGAARFTEHWQPEGHLQASVRQAVTRAVSAAEAAATVQESVIFSLQEAIAAAQAAAAAKKKGR